MENEYFRNGARLHGDSRRQLKAMKISTDGLSVDRRLHSRSIADLEVQLTRLGKQEQRFSGTLADISDAGLCLILPCELWPEELVKLEVADSTLFGHVVYSTWKRNAFRTGVELERVLFGETDLANLLRTALRDMPWATSPR